VERLRLKLRLKIQYAFGYTMSLWLFGSVSQYDSGDPNRSGMAGNDSKPFPLKGGCVSVRDESAAVIRRAVPDCLGTFVWLLDKKVEPSSQRPHL
jgi:hypothetical protein